MATTAPPPLQQQTKDRNLATLFHLFHIQTAPRDKRLGSGSGETASMNTYIL